MASHHQVADRLRFLAPFDPVVWDRRRFQLFWGWEYKLEAYVPAHKRLMGHYAMPVLWGEQMLGWANLKVVDGQLQHELGFAGPRPRGSAFRLALDKALEQMQEFLELCSRRSRWPAGNKFGLEISFATLLRGLLLARPARTFLSCGI
jgi:uncharacterized protein YcaQ